MNQYLQEETPQVFYQGRWVDRNHFRVFVYQKSAKKLANSYEEYISLIESGNWFSTEEEVDQQKIEGDLTEVINIKRARKAKQHGSNS